MEKEGHHQRVAQRVGGEGQTEKQIVADHHPGDLQLIGGPWDGIQKETASGSYDELLLMLSVTDMAEVLGISRAGAYELVKTEGFPALSVGSRIIIPKDEFISWVKRQSFSTAE